VGERDATVAKRNASFAEAADASSAKTRGLLVMTVVGVDASSAKTKALSNQ